MEPFHRARVAVSSLYAKLTSGECYQIKKHINPIKLVLYAFEIWLKEVDGTQAYSFHQFLLPKKPNMCLQRPNKNAGLQTTFYTLPNTTRRPIGQSLLWLSGRHVHHLRCHLCVLHSLWHHLVVKLN